MNILESTTALPNSVFMLHCCFFSCGYCTNEITFNGKLLRALFVVVLHLLDVAYGCWQFPLGDDTSTSQ